MITEDYVSLEIARLLKDKGFNEYCMAFRSPSGALFRSSHDIKNFEDGKTIGGAIAAPTLQTAMKWLREKHNIDIFPWKIGKGIYSCAIFNSNTGQDLSSDKDFPSEKYEETAEAAIKYCLENLI